MKIVRNALLVIAAGSSLAVASPSFADSRYSDREYGRHRQEAHDSRYSRHDRHREVYNRSHGHRHHQPHVIYTQAAPEPVYEASPNLGTIVGAVIGGVLGNILVR